MYATTQFAQETGRLRSAAFGGTSAPFFFGLTEMIATPRGKR
jgi:hypothetical protein